MLRNADAFHSIVALKTFWFKLANHNIKASIMSKSPPFPVKIFCNGGSGEVSCFRRSYEVSRANQRTFTSVALTKPLLSYSSSPHRLIFHLALGRFRLDSVLFYLVSVGSGGKMCRRNGNHILFG